MTSFKVISVKGKCSTFWLSSNIIANQIVVIHHVFHLFPMTFCTDGIFLSLSAFIIFIGYFGLKQKEIFSHFPDNNHDYITDITEPKIKYAGSGLKDADAIQYIGKLNQKMASEKPYLDPNLTLPQLATDLEIPSNYLSQVINETFGLNFFLYFPANSFRLQTNTIPRSDEYVKQDRQMRFLNHK